MILFLFPITDHTTEDNSSSVDANIEDWTDWVGGKSRFCLVTNHINYNEQCSPRLDDGCQYFRQNQHPQMA